MIPTDDEGKSAAGYRKSDWSQKWKDNRAKANRLGKGFTEDDSKAMIDADAPALSPTDLGRLAGGAEPNP